MILRTAIWTIIALAVLGAVYALVLTNIPGVTMTSWWRSSVKNDAVGGVPWSLHQIGLAWDLVPDGAVTQAQVLATGLPFLKLVTEGTHLHVQIG